MVAVVANGFSMVLISARESDIKNPSFLWVLKVQKFEKQSKYNTNVILTP
jgi:hypothetical protein